LEQLMLWFEHLFQERLKDWSSSVLFAGGFPVQLWHVGQGSHGNEPGTSLRVGMAKTWLFEI
jgi:hypothetical protein